jgi:hypothetical protein
VAPRKRQPWPRASGHLTLSSNVTVTAEDAWENTKDDYVGEVSLTQNGGTAGSENPNSGVHINNTATLDDDSHSFLAADNGVHDFPVTCYTAETINTFEAAGDDKNGCSAAVVVAEP